VWLILCSNAGTLHTISGNIFHFVLAKLLATIQGDASMRSIPLGSGWPGLVGRFGLLLLFPVVAGCGSGDVKVRGKVLYNGDPVPGAFVSFRPADSKHNMVTAESDEDGNYEVRLPPGEVKVCVDNRHLAPRPTAPTGLPPGLPAAAKQKILEAQKANPPAQAAPVEAKAPEKPAFKYVVLPPNSYEMEKSGLEFAVEPRGQEHNLEMRGTVLKK
jgi:hypothetical protein